MRTPVSDDVWRAYRRAYWWNYFVWSVFGGGAAMAGLLTIALTAHAYPARDAGIFAAIVVACSYLLYSLDVRAIRAKYLGAKQTDR